MFLVTLAELRPLVRAEVGAERDRFVPDVNLNGWLVAAWLRLYDLYAFSGQPYFEKEKSHDVVAGTAWKVPDDLYRLVRVDRVVDSTGARIELRDLDVHEAAQMSFTSPTLGMAVGYRFRNQEIQLLPTPTAGASHVLVYVPKPEEPKDPTTGEYVDTATMDVVDLSGREWVVGEAAIKAREKRGEDTTTLRADSAAMRLDLTSRAARRTTTRLGKVADVTSERFADPYLQGFGRSWWRR